MMYILWLAFFSLMGKVYFYGMISVRVAKKYILPHLPPSTLYKVMHFKRHSKYIARVLNIVIDLWFVFKCY